MSAFGFGLAEKFALISVVERVSVTARTFWIFSYALLQLFAGGIF